MFHDEPADSPRELHIRIDVHIDGREVAEQEVTVPIPETYEAMDLQALIVREVEDTAFLLNRRRYGYTPTRSALIATDARIRALAHLREQMPRTGQFIEWRERIRQFLDMSNQEVIALWGQDPEGE
jgi:hypothetical protein